MASSSPETEQAGATAAPFTKEDEEAAKTKDKGSRRKSFLNLFGKKLAPVSNLEMLIEYLS